MTNTQCPFCNEWVEDRLHCCEGKHTNDWIEAQYETMGWPEDVIGRKDVFTEEKE